MSKTYDIALCDATSMAAEALIKLLEEKNFPLGIVYPLSDLADSGSVIEFREEELDVLTESGFEFTDVDLVFVPAGSQVDDAIVPRAIEAGCMVIDGSRDAAEQYNSVMFMPGFDETELETALMQKRIVIPSSPAAMLLPVLSPIHAQWGVDRVDITACQAVSTMGNPGVDELRKQTVQLLNGKPADNKIFPRRIAYNLIPEVGTIDGLGISSTEHLIEAELRLGLDVDDIDARSTCVTVPVFFGDSIAVSLDTERPVDLETLETTLASVDLICWFDAGDYPTVEQAAGSDQIMLGRVRKLPGREYSLNFWITADLVRLGALSTVTAAEILIKDFLK